VMAVMAMMAAAVVVVGLVRLAMILTTATFSRDGSLTAVRAVARPTTIQVAVPSVRATWRMGRGGRGCRRGREGREGTEIISPLPPWHLRVVVCEGRSYL
jgi:hypothetical protein